MGAEKCFALGRQVGKFCECRNINEKSKRNQKYSLKNQKSLKFPQKKNTNTKNKQEQSHCTCPLRLTTEILFIVEKNYRYCSWRNRTCIFDNGNFFSTNCNSTPNCCRLFGKTAQPILHYLTTQNNPRAFWGKEFPLLSIFRGECERAKWWEPIRFRFSVRPCATSSFGLRTN